MSQRIRRIWWIANFSWWLGLPIVYAVWLRSHVQWEYEMGYRTSTDGDSLGIPIFGVFVANTLLLLVLNVVRWLVLHQRNMAGTRE